MAYRRVVVCAVILALMVSAKAPVAQTRPTAPQDSFRVIYTFALPGPTAPLNLLEANDGNLYGTTVGGGASRLGVVFRMTSTGTISIVHEFTGTSGSVPPGGLMQASDGYLYGTTNHRGASGDVTIFKMSPNGAFATLHTFTSGGQPVSLLQARDGSFYGTTVGDGASGDGTVFKMNAEVLGPAPHIPATLTTVHAFSVVTDGAFPAALIQARDGNFYGITQNDRSFRDGGLIFRMTPDGTTTILRRFTGKLNGLPETEGAIPDGFIQARDGNFYGTTSAGGTQRAGTVFKMTPDGTVTTLHSFTGRPPEGALLVPGTGLIQGRDGNFYGATVSAVFRMTAGGTLTVLHQWTREDNDTPAQGRLIQARDGSLYGTTYGNGGSRGGTIFKITP